MSRFAFQFAFCCLSFSGEMIGVDYLLRQTGQPLQNVDPDSEETEELLEDLVVEEEEDEGFEEDHALDHTASVLDDTSLAVSSIHPAFSIQPAFSIHPVQVPEEQLVCKCFTSNTYKALSQT